MSLSQEKKSMANFVKINKEEYKELLNKTLFKTFFHDLAWHEFLEQQFKWLRFEYYLYKPASPDASQGGGEAVLPLAKFKVFGKEKLISLPFCEYGGSLPLREEIDFEEFEKDALSEFGKNIKIKFHPQILKFYEVEPRKTPRKTRKILRGSTSTYWIENLKKLTEQELSKSFRKTLRHSIRNAEQQDLQIKRCSDLKELRQFYNLYVANLKQKKTVPYPLSVIKYLYQNPATEILLVLYKDKIIAGSLFLQYDKFIHYFLGASNYKCRNIGANYLILWEKIKSLIGKDLIFDLGASPTGSNLEIFKRGWGGKEYPILQIGTKRSEENLRSSKLRNIWGLLPNFLIKKLSSKLIKYRL